MSYCLTLISPIGTHSTALHESEKYIFHCENALVVVSVPLCCSDRRRASAHSETQLSANRLCVNKAFTRFSYFTLQQTSLGHLHLCLPLKRAILLSRSILVLLTLGQYVVHAALSPGKLHLHNVSPKYQCRKALCQNMAVYASKMGLIKPQRSTWFQL